jgi:hypothetical protein
LAEPQINSGLSLMIKSVFPDLVGIGSRSNNVSTQQVAAADGYEQG